MKSIDWQIHVIKFENSSSAVYFDQIDRRPEVDKVLIELSFHWSMKLNLMYVIISGTRHSKNFFFSPFIRALFIRMEKKKIIGPDIFKTSSACRR
jgi:hypothetical protein